MEKAKPKAMINLKRVKRLGAIVEKRSNALLTIEEILEKIESAQTEEKVSIFLPFLPLSLYQMYTLLLLMSCLLCISLASSL